ICPPPVETEPLPEKISCSSPAIEPPTPGAISPDGRPHPPPATVIATAATHHPRKELMLASTNGRSETKLASVPNQTGKHARPRDVGQPSPLLGALVTRPLHNRWNLWWAGIDDKVRIGIFVAEVRLSGRDAVQRGTCDPP